MCAVTVPTVTVTGSSTGPRENAGGGGVFQVEHPHEQPSSTPLSTAGVASCLGFDVDAHAFPGALYDVDKLASQAGGGLYVQIPKDTLQDNADY
jgi:hypothetical protein